MEGPKEAGLGGVEALYPSALEVGIDSAESPERRPCGTL